MTNIGYICDNNTLNSKYYSIRVKTYEQKGLEYCSELAHKNLDQAIEIMQWNADNDVHIFRLVSGMFPVSFKYNIIDLPDFENLHLKLQEIARLSFENDIRVNFHPDIYCVLASSKESVVDRSVLEMNQHGQICDLMGLPQTPFYNINVHMSTTDGGKENAMSRFLNVYENRLTDSARSRITLENDDKKNGYTVHDLNFINERISVPIVYDYHHWRFCNIGEPRKEALELALNSWPDGCRPETHYSENRQLEHPEIKVKPQSHSDYIYDIIPDYGYDFDITLEAKAKELALLKYRQMITRNTVDCFMGVTI